MARNIAGINGSWPVMAFPTRPAELPIKTIPNDAPIQTLMGIFNK